MRMNMMAVQNKFGMLFLWYNKNIKINIILVGSVINQNNYKIIFKILYDIEKK